MKVSASCLLLALLPALTEAQFGGFPLLPSPPRLFFGGFRPLFPTRSRRPPRRPPPFNFQRPNIFTQPPSGGFNEQNSAGSSQSPFGSGGGFPSTRAVNFSPPPRSRRPQRRPQQQQQQHNNHGDGFGAPKPQSIISRLPEGPPRQQQEFRPVQHQQQQQSRPIQQQQQQQQFLNDPFFHRPVEFINDNSIIGMLPPPVRSGSQQSVSGFQPRPGPPPRPSAPPITPRRPQQAQRPRPPSQVSQVQHVQPSFEQIQLPPQQFPQELQFEFVPVTRLPQQQRPQQQRPQQQRPQQQRPQVPQTSRPKPPPQQTPSVATVPLDPFDLQFNPVNSINSNSLDDLVINKVPSVNAGVLPLAHEKPTQLELFPPFNTRRSG